ncbi:MAG: hypothetical protein AAF125_10930 [Chloroflexota bacterium]
MTKLTRVVSLVGSPKAKNSTSAVLGDSLTTHFEAHGVDVKSYQSHRLLRRSAEMVSFLDDLDRCELFVVSTPTYVDSLPYVLTAVFEAIAAHRVESSAKQGQRILCIANCGFPEPEHNDIALDICRVFADAAGFDWCGGIRISAGGVINGMPLEARGGLTRNYRDAFAQAAHALIDGEDVPETAVEILSKPLIPRKMYLVAGSVGWIARARQEGIG